MLLPFLAALAAVGCTVDGADTPPEPDAGSTCDPGSSPDGSCRSPVSATVSRIVDGDTLEAAVDGGGDETVRLLGVDAPETDEGACGSRAESWLRTRLPTGTRVALSFDAECVDRYDRTLAYVRDDAGFVNAALVAEGQAEACPYEPNTTYTDYLACLEGEASSADAGLWAIGCHLDPCFE